MPLPGLILPSRANQCWLYSGIDSLEHCADKKHFLSYPCHIEYVFNSRGFRDHEWPDSMQELETSIWCIGDSFTVGVGQPFNHIWPTVLSKATDRRTINVSMDGASNDWIYRRCLDIMRCVSPTHIVVMWSSTQRRESDRTDLDDEQRRLFASADSHVQDYMHWVNLANQLHQSHSKIIQTTIPDFSFYLPDSEQMLPEKSQALSEHWNRIKGNHWPACPQNLSDLASLSESIRDEMINLHKCYENFVAALSSSTQTTQQCVSVPDLLPEVVFIPQRLDWARDHHHFDILTSQWLVQQILPRLQC